MRHACKDLLIKKFLAGASRPGLYCECVRTVGACDPEAPIRRLSSVLIALAMSRISLQKVKRYRWSALNGQLAISKQNGRKTMSTRKTTARKLRILL